MKYFIGIVPPDEYKKKIIEFQQQWENHSLPDVVEPHITVKAQGGLTSNKDWIREVEKVCEGFSSFKVALNKPMFFGEGVLFLSVESEEIYDLHRRIVKAISPSDEVIKKYLELDDYIPHLTLGQTAWGLTREQIQDMAEQIEKELYPYPAFDVDFIRIYQEIEENKYIKYMDIPLQKQSF